MAQPNSFPLAGILGFPVAQSRSPVIHNFWLKQHGIAGRYVLLPVMQDQLEQGCGVPEQGAPGQLLAGEGLLGSSVLGALVPDGAGSAQGPRALEPWRLLEEEPAGASHDNFTARRCSRSR